MKNSRRTFIKKSAILLAGTTLLPSLHSTSCSISKTKLAIQLFSLNKQMTYDAKDTLQGLQAIGYRFIEHSNYINRNFYGYSAADFRKLVIDCGLNLLSGHVVLEPKHWNKINKDFTKQWYYMIEDAAIAGQQYVITPWLDSGLWNNEKELRQFMQILNKSGELCKRSGLTFGYHNHDFEFSHYINNMRLYDLILQETDADLVTQQLDVGNIDQKDFSIEALFNSYPGRFKLLHIKNIVESKQRHQLYKSAAINQGILDIKYIIEQARTSGGTTNFIMDQGVYGEIPMLETATLDYKALKGITLYNRRAQLL